MTPVGVLGEVVDVLRQRSEISGPKPSAAAQFVCETRTKLQRRRLRILMEELGRIDAL
jgi:hypothetical protein